MFICPMLEQYRRSDVLGVAVEIVRDIEKILSERAASADHMRQ
jgi:hypothetical protein